MELLNIKQLGDKYDYHGTFIIKQHGEKYDYHGTSQCQTTWG